MSYLRCIICILLCCLGTNVSLAQSFQENKPGIPLMSTQVIREDSLKSLLNQNTQGNCSKKVKRRKTLMQSLWQ